MEPSSLLSWKKPWACTKHQPADAKSSLGWRKVYPIERPWVYSRREWGKWERARGLIKLNSTLSHVIMCVAICSLSTTPSQSISSSPPFRQDFGSVRLYLGHLVGLLFSRLCSGTLLSTSTSKGVYRNVTKRSHTSCTTRPSKISAMRNWVPNTSRRQSGKYLSITV